MKAYVVVSAGPKNPRKRWLKEQRLTIVAANPQEACRIAREQGMHQLRVQSANVIDKAPTILGA